MRLVEPEVYTPPAKEVADIRYAMSALWDRAHGTPEVPSRVRQRELLAHGGGWDRLVRLHTNTFYRIGGGSVFLPLPTISSLDGDGDAYGFFVNVAKAVAYREEGGAFPSHICGLRYISAHADLGDDSPRTIRFPVIPSHPMSGGRQFGEVAGGVPPLEFTKRKRKFVV